MDEPSSRVQVGVIGTGGIARRHLAALRSLSGVDVAALCDVNEQRLAAAAAQWGTPETRTFTEYRRMLDELRLDGVWVLVSVPATFDVTAECLRRGVATMLEKPPGLNTAETRDLAALAEQRRCTAMVAFNRRFSPWVRQAWQLVAAGGRPAVILMEYHKGPQQFAHYPREVNERWIGVDAIHGLDLLRHLGGTVRGVSARSDCHLHGDLPDSFHGVVEFEGGTIGQFVSTYTSVPKIERLQLFGDRYWAMAEGIGVGMNSGRYYQDGAYHEMGLPAPAAAGTDTDGYWAEDRYFVDCLREKRVPMSPAADLRDAVCTMELVDTFLAGWSAT